MLIVPYTVHTISVKIHIKKSSTLENKCKLDHYQNKIAHLSSKKSSFLYLDCPGEHKATHSPMVRLLNNYVTNERYRSA